MVESNPEIMASETILEQAQKRREAIISFWESDNSNYYSIKQVTKLIQESHPELFPSHETCRKFFNKLVKKNHISVEGRFKTQEFNRKETLSIHDQIKSDRERIKTSAKIKELTAKYNHIVKVLDTVEQRYEVALSIKEPVEIYEYEIEPNRKDKFPNAIPVGMFSDWHAEEKVDPTTIGFKNEYNVDIFKKRAINAFQNYLKLIQYHRSFNNIETALVWLGGDLITGYIHEELIEENELSPTEATRLVKSVCISGLDFLKKHGQFKKIIVVCNFGNHGRTTAKPRVSSGYKNSYEWMLYQDLKDYFHKQTIFDFHIPNGAFAYVKTFNFMNRFWHGDNIKYQGGIGGITIPLAKDIKNLNMSTHADFNFLGHFHNFQEVLSNTTINGSLIGYNSYAEKIVKAPFDVPKQGFRLIDERHGLTAKFPIFV